MAEAMIDNEYNMATSLPTLAPPEIRSNIESFSKNQAIYSVSEQDRGCGKVVGFHLPPSPKRQKVSFDSTHRVVIAGECFVTNNWPYSKSAELFVY